MKQFMDEKFLLNNDISWELYSRFADMKITPVIDYHCHIDPKEIYEDKKFDNIAQVWLGGDHYKWRVMRANGIDERYITGDAPDKEKFLKWAETMPKLIGNPLYHWSHLELKYYFGYNGNLNQDTAEEVWELTSAKLKSSDFSARGLIKKSNVKLICTTDDPVDSLEWHEKIKNDKGFDVQVLPAWRPDRALNIEKPGFIEYIKKLSDASGVIITDIDSLKNALIKRLEFFREKGCVISDHGLDYVMYEPCSLSDADAIFKKALSSEKLTVAEIRKYKTTLLLYLAKQYNRLDWAMQLHYGVRRNNNTAMFEKTGADTGFDCIGNCAPAAELIQFLNELSKTDELPKAIIYSLNPNDDTMIDTVVGCFQSGSIKGKIQHGSAWWFNDNFAGMKKQLTSLANQSVLGNFIGMLTDSRSFLSYTRHDYFRRILCSMIGEWVENGEYPYDEKILGEIIKGISYNNAIDYFGFDLEKI